MMRLERLRLMFKILGIVFFNITISDFFHFISVYCCSRWCGWGWARWKWWWWQQVHNPLAPGADSTFLASCFSFAIPHLPGGGGYVPADEGACHIYALHLPRAYQNKHEFHVVPRTKSAARVDKTSPQVQQFRRKSNEQETSSCCLRGLQICIYSWKFLYSCTEKKNWHERMYKAID